MDNYDDENFDDGFDDDALASRMNLPLWRKLFGYARRYPKDLAWLAVFAFFTASMEVGIPRLRKRWAVSRMCGPQSPKAPLP